MKKKLVLTMLCILTALLFVMVFISCVGTDTGISDPDGGLSKEVIRGDFSLTVTVDKAVARVGDTITATVAFKNLGDRDIVAYRPSWMVAREHIEDFTVEDILRVTFTTRDDFQWAFITAIVTDDEPVVFIKSGAAIERQFEHTVSAPGNLNIHAGAFFITPETAADLFGFRISNGPVRITVQ